MKKINLLIITCLFTLGVNAQNCNFTYSFTAGALNVVSFQPNAAFSPNLYHFDWDFGDGHTSTSVAPTHHFNSLPPFRVCYNIYDSTNLIICSACDSVTSPVINNCNITAIQGSGLDVAFHTNSSTNTNVHWSVDGGVTWAGGNPYTHVFNHSGIYNVCMLETESLSGDTICNVCDSVTVTQIAANCTFTATMNPSSNFTFDFAAHNSTIGSSVSWDFGDNTIGTGAQISHTYNTPGTYSVCMTVTEPNGTVCHYCHPVIVGSTHGNCFFTFAHNSTPNSYNFTGMPAFPGSTLSWDFGDGIVATGNLVSHNYAVAGVYTVCMTETDSIGNILCISCDQVGSNPTHCSFTASSNPFHNLTIDFQANSGLFSTVTWDFGDNTSGTGVSISHTYSAPGSYPVCVTILTNGMSCTQCDTIVVSSSPPGCRAGFIATNLGLTGYFIDMSLSTTSNTLYTWDFGDGSSQSHIRFPQYTYNHPGTYNVCLSIQTGNCTDHYCAPLTVDTGFVNPVGCQAFFAIVQLAPYQVTVVNLSNGVNLNFLWDFGDGTSDTHPFPSHFYSSTGSYNLCLTVSDANGCTSTYCDTLSVDTLGNIFRGQAGFTINIVSPSQLTGVNDVIANKFFNVYPNPVTNELNIVVATGSEKANYFRVFSLQGSEILNGNLNGFDGKINMQSLNSGTYLLEISLSDGSKGYQSIIKY